MASEVDGPAELGELLLDLGERELKGGSAMGAGGSLGEDALSLHLERLEPPLFLGFLKAISGGDGLRSGGFRLLLLHGLAFPSTRHG